MKRPFVWFVCGLMSGILSAAYLNKACFAAVTLTVAAVSVFMGVKRRTGECFYVPLFCVLGFLICSADMLSAGNVGALVDDTDAVVRGTVRSFYITESGKRAIQLDADSLSFGGNDVDRDFTVFLTVSDSEAKAGDRVRAEGRLYGFEGATNPYQTDYKMYMLSNGYDCSMWAESVEKTGENGSLIYKVEQARERVNDFFDRMMPQKEAAVMKALTTGYKHGIDENTRETYKNLGISHLLAVSGIHVSVIAGFVFFLFSKIFGGSRRKAMPFAAAFLVLYLFFTGVSPSALRAVIMTVAGYIGYILRRDGDRLNITAFSALVMLIANPFYLWNLSFQLSYAGITAVGAANGLLTGRRMKKPARAFMFSLLVWVFTTPLTMYYFGGASLISPLTNIIFVPYLSWATGLGLLSALASFFGEWALFPKTAGGMIWLYDLLTEKVGTDIFYIDTAKPTVAAVVGMYAFMAFVIFFMGRRKMLKRGVAAFSAAAAVYVFSTVNAPAEVIFFDSGQGDASAVYIPGKLMAVIDGGPEGGAERSVIPYIKAKTERADVLFLSHTDADHSGGAMELIRQGLVDTVVMSAYSTGERADEIKSLAEENGVGIRYMEAGDILELNGCAFKCLYPDGPGAKSENEASLVIKVSLGETDILFTGDISGDNEKELLKRDIDCDIIKIAHHGSSTSSSEPFLVMTGADTAVIEAGEGNMYGFPNEEVTRRLDSLGMETYITGRDGAVAFYMDDDGTVKDVKTFRRS